MSNKGIIGGLFAFLTLLGVASVVLFKKGRAKGIKAANNTGSGLTPDHKELLDYEEEIDTAADGVNNPGNIRNDKSVIYAGEIEGDWQFKHFKNMGYGYRAVIHTLLAYYHQWHKTTLQDIINTYAPPSDGNDTAGYVNAVSRATGIDPHIDILPSLTTAKVKDILTQITIIEQGHDFEINEEDLNKGYLTV